MKEKLPAPGLTNLIFEFRGVKVMIDFDLAALYETETKKLKQQVKRNKDRFPDDFMFRLTQEEKRQLLAMAPRLKNLKHSSVNPIVFTEQGVAMLSSVLTSRRAIRINIDIMRAFARYRMLLLESKVLRKKITALDAKVNYAFRFLLKKIDALTPVYTSKKPIGYKRTGEN